MADKLASTLIDYIISSKDSPARQSFMQRAKKFWKLYRPDNWWERQLPSDDAETYESEHATTKENHMFEKTEEIVSVFFKHLPVIQVSPHKPSDYDISETQNKHIKYAMTEAKFLENMRIGSRDAFITGMNIYHTGWDASKLDVYDNGDCMVQSIPHVDCYLDPMPGITDIQRSRFVAFVFWIPQDTVIDRFGEAAADALGMNIRKKRKPGERMRSPIRGEEIVDRLSFNVGNNEKMMDLFDPKGDLIPVIETWYRTKDFRETQLADDGKTRLFDKVEPLGRVAHMVNGQVVRDISNPFRKRKQVRMIVDDEEFGERQSVPVGHGQFPVVRQVAYQVQDEDMRKGLYDVMGVLEKIEILQWDVNDLANQFMINARTIANPPTIINHSRLANPSLGDAERLALVPALKILVNDKGPISEAVRIEQPASIPSYAQFLLESKRQNIERISGIKGFVAGNIHKGTSHTTAEGTNLVSEADFSMMWTLIQNTEFAMVGIIRQFNGLMQQFYKEGRYTNVSLNGRPFMSEWNSRNIAGEFTFSVISGSSTPQQYVQRMQNVMFAYQTILPIIQNPNPTPDMIRTTLFVLEAANLPWTHQFTAWLQDRLEEVEEQQRLQQQAELLMGTSLLGGGQQQQPQGEDGLAMLAQSLGRTPEDILGQFAA